MENFMKIEEINIDVVQNGFTVDITYSITEEVTGDINYKDEKFIANDIDELLKVINSELETNTGG